MADKIKMRDKRIKARNRQVAAGPAAKPPAKPKIAHSPPSKTIPAQPMHNRARLVAAVDHWRRVALAAGAAAIFSLGLSLGLLVAR